MDTPGLDLAANYIANVFRTLNLKPLPGQSDLFQPFELTVASAVGEQTVFDSGHQTYKRGTDYTVASFSAEKAFAGPVVFAGYGISSPEHNYDDYAGIDVKGKLVIAMRFEPHTKAGKSQFSESGWSMEATLGNKARQAESHGAIALLLVNPPNYHPEGDTLMPFARQFTGERAGIPVLQITQGVANDLLKRGAVRDLKALQQAIDDTGKPSTAELNDVTASGKVQIQRTVRTVKNVVAYLPGKGPHADEYIVVGAHYDHLGYGGIGSLAPTTRAIHHGADDNASGTAAMLEIADRLSAAGPYPRSIIFIAFTAEERGLLGSNHFVNHPPIPLAQIEAMVNLDMVGRVRNSTLYIGGAGTAASFDDLVKDAAAVTSLELKPSGRGGYAPSDHMSFVMKKIPVLFFWSGLHADYHRPSDEASKINYEGLDETAGLAAWMVQRLAQMPKPTYVEVTEKRSTTRPGDPSNQMGVGSVGSRASLGVIPDYTQDESTDGVRLSGSMPGSPAAAAGLKEGDVLVGFGDSVVHSLYDLSDLLSRARPGEKVKLKVKRGNEQVETEATLAERKE